MCVRLRYAVLAAVGACSIVRAQAPAFDAASVKQNRSGSPGSRVSTPEGRFNASNALLADLIQNAYRVQPFQIVGIPEGVATSRFDVEATVPRGTAPSLVPVMLQGLLADRFALTVHREMREQPVYALVVARPDRRLGPELTPSSQDCAAVSEGGPLRAPVTGLQPDGRPTCGMMMSPARIRAGGMTMTQLANALAAYVRRTVVDDTRLEGFFDFELRYSAQGRGGGPAASPDDAPAIFTAVQEQLGLKLEPRQARVDVLVVERARLPSDN